MAQVEVLNDRPAGRLGEMEQLVIALPEFEGDWEPTEVPVVNENGDPP